MAKIDSLLAELDLAKTQLESSEAVYQEKRLNVFIELTVLGVSTYYNDLYRVTRRDLTTFQSVSRESLEIALAAVEMPAELRAKILSLALEDHNRAGGIMFFRR